MRCEKPYKYRHILVHRTILACDNTCMLESPPTGTEPEVTLGVRAALLEAECIDLRARIEAREQRIRLLEEALRSSRPTPRTEPRAFERRRRAGGAF